VLLADERTQSHAEFTAMCLQTAPSAVTIGSQTAGADGNVSLVGLPGKISTYFSGIGVYYPDGAETQKVGVRIDITVRPTIVGIQTGRDEVLEKALEYLNDRFGGSADREIVR
jgi:C-terminal processing protease CtpA/Prc